MLSISYQSNVLHGLFVQRVWNDVSDVTKWAMLLGITAPTLGRDIGTIADCSLLQLDFPTSYVQSFTLVHSTALLSYCNHLLREMTVNL